jgi:thiosulfate/3-mercaptopyruvate sulfurtransferase
MAADAVAASLEDAEVTLIDARPETEYTGERVVGRNPRGGHVPGAYNLYWEDLLISRDEPRLKDLNAVRARFAEAGASEDGVVVSYCQIGMRASYTYLISRHLGYDARFYDGSWMEWSAMTNLPAVQGASRR